MVSQHKKVFSSGWWVWLINAILIPAIIMIYLYVQNKLYIDFVWVLSVTIAMILFTLLAWTVVSLVFQSPLSSFVSCAIGWILLFSYNPLNALIHPGEASGSSIVLFLIGTVLAALAAAWMLRKLPGIKLRLPVLLFMSIMFVMNSLSAAQFLVETGWFARLNRPKIKDAFVVSDVENKPNIYWIVCDGMLGFDSVEKYFGDSQEWFSDELTQRDFQINRSANFEGSHATVVAVPSLMCPFAYDSYISKYTSSPETIDAWTTDSIYWEGLDWIRRNNELFHAFNAAGYTTRTIACRPVFFYPTVAEVYDGTSIENANLMFSSEKDLERKTVYAKYQDMSAFLQLFSYPLAVIFEGIGEATNYYTFEKYEQGDGSGNIEQYLSDEVLRNILCDPDTAVSVIDTHSSMGAIMTALNDMAYTTGNLTTVHYMMSHFPFFLDENGNTISSMDNSNVQDYHAQHVYSSKVLLNMVDFILERDPEAIIVLQADHGLHGNTEEEFNEAFGPNTPPQDLWNHVMSAIRLPEKYRNGDEHYAFNNPLNISRYLVNSFVGPNYNYLS